MASLIRQFFNDIQCELKVIEVGCIEYSSLSPNAFVKKFNEDIGQLLIHFLFVLYHTLRDAGCDAGKTKQSRDNFLIQFGGS